MLYVLCGLPGSGKSTWANEQKDMITVSSDAIRKELYGNSAIQRNPQKVFAIVNARVKKYLNLGYDVIYDSTALTKKLRADIIDKFNTETVCVFINTPLEECIRRNANRARKVPEEVIERMAEKLEIPTKDEKFSKIIVIKT